MRTSIFSLALLAASCGDPNDPASRATAVRILSAPASTLVSDTVTLLVQATDAEQLAVPDVPFEWSSSDPAILAVDASATGRLVGVSPGSAWGVVRIPNGAADSVRVRVQSRPTLLAVASGDGQQGIMHNPLPAAVEFHLTAPGGIAVEGVGLAVTVTGGGTADPVAVTDSTGRARVIWTMGPDGEQTLRAVAQIREPLDATATATVVVPGTWTWVYGDSMAGASGVYGSIGVATDQTTPGGRDPGAHWVGPDGSLWLFGGFGYDATGTLGWLSDLWRFDGTRWTWVSGSDATNAPGVYGTKGAASPINRPGARREAAGWMDADGTIWVFGGTGFDARDSLGILNDWWRFDGSSWAWMGGDSLIRGPGVFGIRGIADAANVPSARLGAAYWTDQSGHHWLFGRAGDFQELRNDLWSLTDGVWTWVAGDTTDMPSPRYGALGVPTQDNVPGGHGHSAGWATGEGMIIFAGYGVDINVAEGEMNDVWRHNSAGWAWIAGSPTADPLGAYGTRGLAAASNTPGGRTSAAYTAVAGGGLIFGGFGREQTASLGTLNDLWFFDGTRWTWLAGTRFTGSAGVYGTRGTPHPANTPGARAGAVLWPASGNSAWLFGGSSGNDLWKWEPN